MYKNATGPHRGHAAFTGVSQGKPRYRSATWAEQQAEPTKKKESWTAAPAKMGLRSKKKAPGGLIKKNTPGWKPKPNKRSKRLPP
jgi:hypothetical protein